MRGDFGLQPRTKIHVDTRGGESRRRALPAIVVATVSAVALGAFLARGVHHEFRGNASGLFYFGDAWRDGGGLPENAIIGNGPGYDGQFYYRVARDPLLPLARLSGARADPAIGIDTPAYRYRRIAYPLAARLAALGSTEGLTWSFPLVSVLGLALGVFCTCRLFETFGWQPWWGVSYALLPGLVFGASRNLCEGLAIALVSAALLANTRRRMAASIALLTLAHLAHETTLVVSIGCFVRASFRADRPREAAPYLVPIAVALLWYAIVAAAFPPGLVALLSPSGSEGLGVPFQGMLHKLGWILDPEHAAAAYAYLPKGGRFWKQEALLMPPILFAVLVLAAAAWKRSAGTWLTGLLALLFVVMLGDPVWQDAASYARVTSLALLLALRSVAEAPDWMGYAFLASLPFGTVSALGWCADSWRGWMHP